MRKEIQQILEEYKRIWALEYSSSLLNWDMNTYMPEDGAKFRGEALSKLDELKREEILKLKDKVEKIESNNLDDFERGVVRVLSRAIRYYVRIPKEITEELTKVTSEAFIVWKKARSENNYKLFEPYLLKIIDLEKQIAEKLGYEKHPYDALLDLYEEGLTVDDMDKVFSSLLPELKRILERTLEKGYFPQSHPLEGIRYEEEVMKKVNQEIIEILEMPKMKFRLDVSPHPFTIRISTDDVRITTRYEGIDFKRTIFSVIHETGHAIYELLIDPSLEMTPLAGGVSSGVHESQSRFWENVIGKSREFVSIIYPVLKKYLGFLRDYDEEEVYKYFNTIRPGLIRVDADELTYNFHIALRYEIEKGLLEEKIKVDEIPQIWNEFMEKYLGVKPKTYSEGVLQDVHWSNGSFGYFPTYTLGNVIAGMIYVKFPLLKEKIINRKFNEIKEYLKEKICKYGMMYPPKTLLSKSFGDTYNPDYLIKYLEEKYLL